MTVHTKDVCIFKRRSPLSRFTLPFHSFDVCRASDKTVRERYKLFQNGNEDSVRSRFESSSYVREKLDTLVFNFTHIVSKVFDWNSIRRKTFLLLVDSTIISNIQFRTHRLHAQVRSNLIVSRECEPVDGRSTGDAIRIRETRKMLSGSGRYAAGTERDRLLV